MKTLTCTYVLFSVLQDDSTGEMIFDEVFHALSRCLAGLAQPFTIPGTDQLFKPKIFITILAYSSIIGLTSHQVIGQHLICHLSVFTGVYKIPNVKCLTRFQMSLKGKAATLWVFFCPVWLKVLRGLLCFIPELSQYPCRLGLRVVRSFLFCACN